MPIQAPEVDGIVYINDGFVKPGSRQLKLQRLMTTIWLVTS